MTLPAWAPRVGALVLVLVLSATAKLVYDHGVADRALAAAQARELATTRRQLQRARDSTTIVYRRDTLRQTREVTRWRAFRDTLLRSDTVRLTVRESVLVFRADSVVNQCVMTAQTCAALQAQKDSLLLTVQLQLDAERRQRPGFFRRVGETLKWVGLGAAIGAVVTR